MGDGNSYNSSVGAAGRARPSGPVPNPENVLVIDWSNIMFRSLFMHRLFSRSGGDYERVEDLRSFTHKFATDICSLVNMFRPNGVIIATDGQHAWRKDVLPGENGYKCNREKDPNVNWQNVFKCSDDLLRILSRRGMHVASAEHAEADDIMAMVKEAAFESHPEVNLVIVSADADIRQLIDFDPERKQWCAVYNTTGKGRNGKRSLYVTKEFEDWFRAPQVYDIFNFGVDVRKSYVSEVLKSNSVVQLAVDDPDRVVLDKILCGDDGDNVPAFYGFYKNGRYVRITPSKAKKILEQTGARNVRELVESLPRLPEAFESACKRKIDDLDYSERLARQRTLVELDSSLFPPAIREYKETIEYMLRDCGGRTFQNLRVGEILAGTEYEHADRKRALDADVFRSFGASAPTVNGVPLTPVAPPPGGVIPGTRTVRIDGVDFPSAPLFE